MADNQDLTIKVGADTAEAESSLKKFSSDIGSNIIALNQGLELTSKLVNTIGKAIDTAFDFALAGEEIKAIGVRFAAIAEQAGLVPEEISKGIEDAVHGTVDMEDALKAASSAMISLGTNSERIPQLFDLAKKASMQFGGDAIERFDAISRAIATGSTKQLAAIGITVKAEEAYQKYANEIGIAKENLSEAQRQQALMNAVLESGEQKFKNINSSVTPLSESLKQQKVILGDLKDTAAIFFNNTFGELMNRAIQNTTQSLEMFNIKLGEVLLGKIPTAEENLKKLNYQMKELIVAQDMAAVKGDVDRAEQLNKEAEALRQQIIIQEQIINQEKTAQAVKQQSIDTHNAAGDAKKNEAQKTQDLRTEHEKIIDTWKSAEYSFATFKDGFIEGVAQMSSSMVSLGRQVASTFVNGFSNAFAAMGKALVKGQDVFGAFGKAILNMLGNIALQMGNFYIAAGIAAMFLNPGQGAGMIAAGIGLSMLGGVLMALGGESGGDGSQFSGAGGTSGTSGGLGDGMSLTTDQERQTPQTGVQVIVQGNILNSRDSALEIANVLNDAFDMSGTIVRANA